MFFADSTLRVYGTWLVTRMQRVATERLMKRSCPHMLKTTCGDAVARKVLPVAKCGDLATICLPLRGLYRCRGPGCIMPMSRAERAASRCRWLSCLRDKGNKRERSGTWCMLRTHCGCSMVSGWRATSRTLVVEVYLGYGTEHVGTVGKICYLLSYVPPEGQLNNI